MSNFSPNLKSVNLSVLAFNVFSADTLHHTVTLTSDPLTLNVCNVSAVMWSISISNMSEIEQAAGV